MYIAREKRQNNIAEYIIYMWQIEALIRTMNFDIEAIYHGIINSMNINDSAKSEVKNWYRELIKNMQDQKLTEKGHLIELKELLNELQLLNDMLYNMIQDKQYIELFDKAAPNIIELRKKSDTNYSDVELCFNGLFGLMQMRLQQVDISKETEEAIGTFSNLIAYLSVKFNDMKSGKLDFPNTMKN